MRVDATPIRGTVRRLGVLWLMDCLLVATLSHAHPLAPNFLGITEAGDGRLAVTWKEPANTPRGAEMAPELPAGCAVLTSPSVEPEGAAFLYRWEMQCEKAGLVGERIAVSNLSDSRSAVLVRLQLADTRVVQEFLTADRDEVIVPARISSLRLAGSYLSMGFHHLMSGRDHVLLLFGLLLLIADARVLVATVTSFTLGHALTLTLAALGLVGVNGAWVEVAIAASILVLAAEILRSPETRRRIRGDMLRPCAMALVFGLLHGLGFAGALAEVGLPPSEIPLALFSFNLGIEAGQLVALAVMGSFLVALARLIALGGATRVIRARSLAAYGIGTIASYWCFERISLLV